MADHAAPEHRHVHDDVDWAAMAGALTAWDDLEAARNHAIVGWLGVRPGHVAVDVGSGAGGMAVALVDAVGPPGTVVIADGSAELLAVAQHRARRLDHHLIAVHADLEHQALSSVLDKRSVDLVHASAVVHHLDDELAAVTDLASVVRPEGRVAIAEGGLDNRYLPDDCGIGEPGLEQRLASEKATWFWREVRPAAATVRTGWGWNVLLADAGLVDVATRSFILDLPPPLSDAARRVVRGVFERELHRNAEQLGPADQATIRQLLDDEDPRGLMRRPDVFVLGVRTVHVGTVPA